MLTLQLDCFNCPNSGQYLEQDQVVAVHHLLAEHHRQELVECDVLDQSCSDVTSYLENLNLIKLSGFQGE